MILNANTVQILKNFSTINESLVINGGAILKTMAPSKYIIAKANIDQQFPCTISIRDLSNFLSVVSMYDGADIEFNNNHCIIHNKQRDAAIRYFYCDPINVTKPPAKDLVFPSPIVKFNVSNDTLKECLKALAVLGLPNISFNGDGENLYIQAVDSKNISSNSYKKVIGTTEQTFSAIFKIENIKLLPKDYIIEISSPRSHGSVGAAHFISDNIEYWILVEENSKF
jgi:hypothetical protein